MKAFTRLFANLFTNNATSDNEKIHREWDHQRAKAMSPSELSEIDAIFSRSIQLTFIHVPDRIGAWMSHIMMMTTCCPTMKEI